MAKKKKIDSVNGPFPSNEPMVDQVGESPAVEAKAFAPNPEADTRSSSKPRISVTLTPDGAIDYDSMRVETVNKIKELLRDPRNQQILGADQKLPELISDQDIDMLYGLLTTLETFAFNMAGKIDIDIAQKHTAMHPEQMKLLRQPTKNVLIKHMEPDSFFFKWKDEIVLSLLLLTITRAKFEAARQEQAIRNEEKRRENPATQDAMEVPVQ